MKESKKPPIRLALSKSVFEIAIVLSAGCEEIRIRGLGDAAHPSQREEELVHRYLIAEGFTKKTNKHID